MVDLDRVYMMLDDASSMSSDSVSRQARRAAAAPTEQFVAGGIQLVVEGGLLDAGRPRAVVADRDGAIYWRAPADQVPDFDEALSWLAYINVLEPECGCCAPCWPEAEPTSI